MKLNNNNKKLKFKIKVEKEYQEAGSNIQHSSQNEIWEYILTKHNDEKINQFLPIILCQSWPSFLRNNLLLSFGDGEFGYWTWRIL